jgi:phasin family protein
MKLNVETARATLQQATAAARELLSVKDPEQLMTMRTKLAQINMQQAATYAQSIYDIVSDTQRQLGRLWEDQIAQMTKSVTAETEGIAKGTPGAEFSSAALKSTLAATSAMMESLNQATRQFAELSESTMKAATAQMVKSATHT